jgi:hypothetical protein
MTPLTGAEIAKRRREGFYLGLSDPVMDGYQDMRSRG